jgi:hypothetical protein
MSKVITVPFLRLVFCHHEIGCHRDRKAGFREVFRFRTLQNLPFLHLATRVKRAYEGKAVPSHKGWPAQHEAIRWLVDKGRDGIYALDDKGIKVIPTSFGSFAIRDGNHRALALYVLGEEDVRARISHT